MHSKRLKLLNLAKTALFVTFLHMWNYFKIQSNKSFSWEYSSITAAVCSLLLSKAFHILQTMFQAEQPQDPSLQPSNRANSNLSFAQALDLAEPEVLLLPGMFLLWSTALLVSPSDRGPANPSKGAPTPLLLDLFLFIYLQILLLLAEIFIMICMFGCIFMNT